MIKTIGEVKEILDIEPEGQVYNWGLKAIDVFGSWAKGYKGKGIPIFILDTGVDYRHPDLKDNIRGGKCTLSIWKAGWGWGYPGGDSSAHGTHVAGIAAGCDNGIGIIGVAPEADIWSVRVLYPEGYSGSAKTIARGIEYATEKAIKDYGYGGVINLSLGGSEPTSVEHNAVKSAVKEGMIIVAAAGNEAGEIIYPAKFDEVIAVGAIDKNRLKADFSNYGEALEVVAPGKYIYSTYPNNRYCKLSGTSMSAPYVSGVACLACQKYSKKFNQEKFRNLLKEGCIDLGEKGFDFEYGYGLIDSSKIASLPEGRDIEVLC